MKLSDVSKNVTYLNNKRSTGMIKGCAYEVDGVRVNIRMVKSGISTKWLVLAVSHAESRAVHFDTFARALCNSQAMVDSMRLAAKAA